MVFSVDHESKQVIVTILHDSRTEQYECIISACQNPVCTCASVYLELNPMPIKNEDDRPMHLHRVSIDITEKILVHEGKFRTPIDDLDFAKSFLSTLNENDYSFLHGRRFEFKNIITESANVDSIDAHFDYGQVEGDGLMSAYNDVLPYGDRMLVTIDDKQYIAMDQFCLLPKCPCTDTTLSIMPIDGVGKIGAEVFSFSLNYRKKQWKETEKHSFSLSTKTLRSAIEAQIPDIYERLLARHIRLKGIYAHCKKRHFMSKQPLEIPRVGRNDPCPCGSGKKYKKCCLDKVTGVASVSWDIDKVGAMSTEEIFEKLNTMDIHTDHDQFLQDVQKFYSASSLANHWLRPIGLDIQEVDFVHYAAVILWERLASDVINDETIDNLMQQGYLMFEKGRSKTACQIWLTVWGYLKPRFTSDMKSIRDADIVFAGNQNLYNWTQDLEMELGNADLHEDRIKYCREFCDLFPESPDLILQNMNMAEAEGYFNIGETEKANNLFSYLQNQYPDCVWVYCRWGDLFAFNRDSNISPDYEKAEKIYRLALDRNIDNEGDVTDRLRDMKKMQKKKK